jgi:cell division protein FtsN
MRWNKPSYSQSFIIILANVIWHCITRLESLNKARTNKQKLPNKEELLKFKHLFPNRPCCTVKQENDDEGHSIPGHSAV